MRAAARGTTRRIGIVGAGLAGLTAARALADAGCAVTVFEKSRAPGGRAATRRDGAHEFDHGAQYFTQRDPRVAPLVTDWARRGLVVPWRARLVAWSRTGTHEVTTPDATVHDTRWVAVPGMRALGVRLAEGLDVRYGTTVRSLGRDAGDWQVQPADTSAHGPFDTVLVTAPAPQAHALLAPHAPSFAPALSVPMAPCLAALLVLEAPPTIAWDGAFVNGHDVLAWVARNASKPGRPPGECWVLHATPAWSEAHLEREPGSLLPALQAAFAEVLGATVTPIRAIAHRWRFALPQTAVTRGAAALGVAPGGAHGEHGHGAQALHDGVLGLGAAGDWCAGGRVEGAIRSGLALAGHVLAAPDSAVGRDW